MNLFFSTNQISIKKLKNNTFAKRVCFGYEVNKRKKNISDEEEKTYSSRTLFPVK